MYFQNIRNVKIVDAAFSSIRLVNSSVSMNYLAFSDVRGSDYYLSEIDSNSCIYSENERAQLGRPLQGLIINSIPAY